MPNVEKENAFTRVWDAHVAKQPAGNITKVQTLHMVGETDIPN